MDWSSPAPSTVDVARAGGIAIDARSIGMAIDDLRSTRLGRAAEQAVDAWEGPLAYHRLRGQARRPILVSAGELVRYCEPALVPVAAGVWLHVLAVMARAL